MLEPGALPLIERRDIPFASSGRRGSNGFVW
jgi:hypothetical protein